jgi:hypothetical protein
MKERFNEIRSSKRVERERAKPVCEIDVDIGYSDRHLEQDVVITKIDIFERMRVRFKENERTMEYKVGWLQTALGWLMGESVCFILFLLYLSLC